MEKEISFKTNPTIVDKSDDLNDLNINKINNAKLYSDDEHNEILELCRIGKISSKLEDKEIEEVVLTLNNKNSKENLEFSACFTSHISYFSKALNQKVWIGYDNIIRTTPTYVKMIKSFNDLTPNEQLYLMFRL